MCIRCELKHDESGDYQLTPPTTDELADAIADDYEANTQHACIGDTPVPPISEYVRLAQERDDLLDDLLDLLDVLYDVYCDNDHAAMDRVVGILRDVGRIE